MMERLIKEYAHASPMASVGWLFADLLLALAMLFLAANTVAVTPPPQVLSANPMRLTPKSPQCVGKPVPSQDSLYQCHFSVGETLRSVGSVRWQASSDLGNTMVFNPASGTLAPGKQATVDISAIPCHNGSFIISGSQNVKPVLVQWSCNAPQERLDFQYQEFTLQVSDVTGLLNNNSAIIADIKQQVRRQSILQNRSVGLAIVYGGAPDPGSISTAQDVANHIYDVLKELGKEGFAFQRASYYEPLYVLSSQTNLNTVAVDVYLFIS